MEELNQAVDRALHITDIHFWELVKNPFRMLNKRFFGNLNVWLRRRRHFPMKQAEPFADYAASLGVKHAVLTGDFTSTSTEKEFALASQFVRGLEERGMIVSVLPGNHDVYTFESERHRRFEHHFASFLPDEGYPCRITLANGTPLILVPTVCANFVSSQGKVGEDTVQAVVRMLEESPPRVLVTAHYPLLPRTRAYVSPPMHRLVNAGTLRQALGDSGKHILYISGHMHQFSYVRDRKYPNLEHLTTGAFFRKSFRTGIEGELSEIHVSADGFRVFRHCYEGQWGRVSQRLEEPRRAVSNIAEVEEGSAAG